MIFDRKPSRIPGHHNFTERVRKVLAMAREEAARLHHGYVGTEHILLGLIREGEGVAAAVLQNLGVDRDEIRRTIEKVVAPGTASGSPRSDLPYTSRAKKVLELAMAEAREFNHGYLGTEHLLLGLLREEKGIAAQVLTRAGLSLEKVRDETRQVIGEGVGRAPSFTIEIDDTSSRSIYEQIIDQIQEAIATKRLLPNDRLPTVRQLADRLDIAPGTVARAYSELEQLGVVVTDGARGTRVAARRKVTDARAERSATLAALLRPIAVEAFHLGATEAELRRALDVAVRGIFT